MKITNTRIFQSETNIEPGTITFDHESIAQISLQTASISSRASDHIDAENLILSPGWIDLQINGAFGLDFTNDPSCLWDVAAKLPQYGVTTFLPTIITSSKDTYRQAIEIWRQGPPAGWRGAIPLGWHFEGPFINMKKKGAHDPNYVRTPDNDFSKDWSRENGVFLVTMAPELPGALDIARQFISRGIILSAGHSMATFEETARAVEAGYRAATHLFNAMPPIDHRSPGLAVAAMLNSQITVGLIPDGIHVHPGMVELAWRLKGAHKMALITDAMAALGVPPGIFVQAGMEVIVDSNSARLRDGTLAGSILGLDQALRNLMEFTHSRAEQILPALSVTPANLLQLNRYGKIQEGCKSHFTLLNDWGQVAMTIIDGEVLYTRN